jgi:predicted butyrate kinase (DUF1464 family)
MTAYGISNPNGAQGYTDLQTKLGNVVWPFKAAAAITKGQLVEIVTGTATQVGMIRTAITNGVLATIVGVALETIPANGVGNVAVAGAIDGVSAHATVAVGDIVRRSATSAGYVVASNTPAEFEAFGIALTSTATVGTISVWKFAGPAAG